MLAFAATVPARAPVRMADRVCRQCRRVYDTAENGPRACRWHPTHYSGRLLRVETTDTSDLTHFWECCGEESVHAPGCSFGAHRGYDE